MNLFRSTVLAALFAVASFAHAEALLLPSGLGFDPDDALDLTYQVVPQYDDQQKVIAGWHVEKLQYFIVVEKLPPGWLDGQKYLQLLAQDMRSRGRLVEVGRSGQYKTAAGLVGRYVELKSRDSAKDAPTVQVVHHVTDGKLAYFAIASGVSATADVLLKEMRELFQTASFGAAAAQPYVGAWAWSGAAPDGRPATAVLTVRQDMTFTSEVAVDGKVVQRGSGFWSVTGALINWGYEKSEPPMPAKLREDEDEIRAIDAKRWVLRSKLSGEEREFVRR
jgi:hypothetical protein